jgi:hypothetical protein
VCGRSHPPACLPKNAVFAPALTLALLRGAGIAQVCDFASPRTIACPSGQVIEVTGATYGRQVDATCPGPGGPCTASNVINTIRARCNGQSSCPLDPTGLADPCSGVRKYLEVRSSCVQPGERRGCWSR